MDDYISRQAAIDAIDNCTKFKVTEDFYTIYINEVEEAIANVPTADIRENVKGEWLADNDREKSMMWRCSVCGRIAYYPPIGSREAFAKHCGYAFCPNCGADMRGER